MDRALNTQRPVGASYEATVLAPLVGFLTWLLTWGYVGFVLWHVGVPWWPMLGISVLALMQLVTAWQHRTWNDIYVTLLTVMALTTALTVPWK